MKIFIIFIGLIFNFVFQIIYAESNTTFKFTTWKILKYSFAVLFIWRNGVIKRFWYFSEYFAFDMNFLINIEHNYSLREEHSSHLKRTKYLFPPVQHIQPYSETIDVTSVSTPGPPEYDVEKSLRRMEECESFVIFARFHRTEESDDWEDAVPKSGWTFEQMDLFKRVVKILHNDRLARLALADSWSEPAKRRIHVDRTAQRFSETMTSFKWEPRLSQWLHGLLIEHLHLNYLAAYIDVLQTLKCRIPSLIERLLAGSFNGKAPAVQQGMNLLLKRPWYPAVPPINAKKLGKLPGNPVIVLVPSILKKYAQGTPRFNTWSVHLSGIATLITITPVAGSISSRMTPPAYLEQMVSTTKARLALVRSEYPGRPVVIVGWRSGAAVALQAAATEPVSACVTLGFATRTVEGPRGDPDDSIYNLTCPVLFVTGENASTSRPEELEEIRSKMVNVTGLIVLGSSDDCLRMRRRQKIALGITQSIVDRVALEAIGDFLADILLQPNAPTRTDKSQILASALAYTQRKRHLSTTSSMDSDKPIKQLRPGNLGNPQIHVSPMAAYKSVNGNSPLSNRRGRKPGSLNKNTRTAKVVKKLQTLSPIKKVAEVSTEANRAKDVTLDVGSISSLGPTGPIMRTPQNTSPSTQASTSTAQPSSSESTTPLQTFRIHAGRVSATSAPPADVMPLRPSDGSNAYVKEDTKSPIMTLTSVARATRPVLQAVRPSAIVRPSISPVKSIGSIVRPSTRFNIGSKLVGTQRNVIMMTDKRLVSSSPTASGSIKLSTSPTKVMRSPVTQLKTTASRLSLTKRLVATSSSPLQQKPIIVKSRTVKADNDNEAVKMMIVKPEEKSKFMLKRAGNDSAVPLMIIKNRSIMSDDAKGDGPEGSRNKVVKEPKRLVFAPSGEYLISNSSSPKYIIKSSMGSETYEVVDTNKDW